MSRQPIDTAPRDGQKILGYGTYGRNEETGQPYRGWLVVSWVPRLKWTEDGRPVDGWKSETGDPYKDDVVLTHWDHLPPDPA